jgi:hypothetical protein
VLAWSAGEGQAAASKEKGMITTFDPVVRTRTVSRAVGPYLIALAVMLFVRQRELPTLLTAYMQNEPLVLATGAFTMMAGLALMAAHHHWTGPSAIVISFVGIVATLKGAWLMIAPRLGSQVTEFVIQAPSFLPVVAGVVFLIGFWLSCLGWLSKT